MSIYFSTNDGEVFEYDHNELKHFGIKGMKWGVRRYQNPDGSLTPAGKARYGSAENYNAARAKSSSRNKKIAAGVGAGALAVGAGALALRSSAGRRALKRAAGSVKSLGTSKETVQLSKITNSLNNKKTRVNAMDLLNTAKSSKQGPVMRNGRFTTPGGKKNITLGDTLRTTKSSKQGPVMRNGRFTTPGGKNGGVSLGDLVRNSKSSKQGPVMSNGRFTTPGGKKGLTVSDFLNTAKTNKQRVQLGDLLRTTKNKQGVTLGDLLRQQKSGKQPLQLGDLLKDFTPEQRRKILAGLNG